MSLVDWERFSERGKQAIHRSVEIASKHQDNYVSGAHLLAGLLDEPDCVACLILQQELGIPIIRVQRSIEPLILTGSSTGMEEMQLTPLARRIIDLAANAAELDSAYIGTEHILLGIVQAEDDRLNGVLHPLGATPDATLQAVCEFGPNEANRLQIWFQMTSNARGALSMSQQLAQASRSEAVTIDHLLLALLRDQTCPLTTLLLQTNQSQHCTDELERRVPHISATYNHPVVATPKLKAILMSLTEIAEEFGTEYIDTPYLALAILRNECPARETLHRHGVTAEIFTAVVRRTTSTTKQ